MVNRLVARHTSLCAPPRCKLVMRGGDVRLRCAADVYSVTRMHPSRVEVVVKRPWMMVNAYQKHVLLVMYVVYYYVEVVSITCMIIAREVFLTTLSLYDDVIGYFYIYLRHIIIQKHCCMLYMCYICVDISHLVYHCGIYP